MKYLKDIRLILAVSIIIIVIITETGKSIRINQLKKVEKSKIEAMGNYEKMSKTDYLKIIDSVKYSD